MNKILVSFLFILLSHLLNAQDASIYPLSFLRIYDNYIYDNPASGVLIDTSEVNIISSHFTGLAGKVGLNYLNVNLTSGNRKKRNAHTAGIIIHSEFETKILKRTRAYLRYSYNTDIGSGLKASAGINAGIFNYFIKASSSSAGMSVIVPDAAVGLWLNGYKFNIGLSTSQIFNSIVKPVNTYYSLRRYFSLHADYKILDMPSYELNGVVQIMHEGKKIRYLTPGMRIMLFNNFSAELNYTVKKGITFSAGIVKFPFLTYQGNLYLSYFQTSGYKNYLNTSRIELNIKVNLINQS
jgi:hypothetical protein